MRSHFEKITRLGDIRIRRLLKTQCTEPNHPEYGGFIVEGKGFSEPAWVMFNACYLFAQYYNEKSVYFKNPLLLKRGFLAMNYTVSRQYEDGTIDLLETTP